MSTNLDGICALTLASLFTFVIALGTPLLELETGGITSHTSLFGALVALWNEDMQLWSRPWCSARRCCSR